MQYLFLLLSHDQYSNVNCLFITAIYCPVPDGIKYGVVRLDDKDRKPDSKVHYQCNKGYRLYGNPWRKCQYDGYWGGKAPVCKRKFTSCNISTFVAQSVQQCKLSFYHSYLLPGA